jgi:hypothetical protein
MNDNNKEPPTAAAADADARTGGACSLCGKPALKAYRPFCSKRCADVDLSRWLNGVYAVPGEPADEDEEEA